MRIPELMIVLLAAEVLLIGVVLLLTPRLTRPDIWFSVTVDPGFPSSPEGRRILRGFRVWSLLACAAAVAIVMAALATKALFGFAAAAGVAAQLIGQALAFLGARRRTLPHAARPSAVREATLTAHSTRLPGGVAAQAGPFVIMAAGAAWIGSRWRALPPRFPTHWDLAGHADAWAARSVASVFGAVIGGFVLCGLLVLVSWTLVTRSRRISPTGERAEGEARFRSTTLAGVLAAEYLIAATFVVLTALPFFDHFFDHPSVGFAAIMSAVFVFVVLTVAVMARIGQGGTRLIAASDGGPPIGDRTADANWRWGFVYVNRGDPALFVEKRFGLGYTFNFGNPWSWAMLAALVIVPIAVTFLVGLAR